MLKACRQSGGAWAGFTGVTEEFLLSRGIGAVCSELPMWVPRGSSAAPRPAAGSDRLGMVSVDCSKAAAAGLRSRQPAETARDALAWALGREPVAPQGGLEPGRERALLGEWHAAEAAQGPRPA